MTDALNMPIEVGDTILFPAPGKLMEAVVTRLKESVNGIGHIYVYPRNSVF